VPLIHEPVARSLGADLRAAVLRLRVGETRRWFPPVIHLGRPGHDELSFTDAAVDRQDPGLRRDVVAGMLRHTDRAVEPLLWMTRPGEIGLEDVDAAWLSAAWAAHEEAGVSLTMVVVTRHGWWDPRSDVRRTWRRLRDRSGGAPQVPG
jgi:hypothetical protein